MSKIEWTQETWNPIVGCSIVSPGCTNCYAMKMAARLEALCVSSGRAFEDDNYPSQRDPHPTAHYRGTVQETKAGPVWTGKVALAPDSAFLKPLKRKKPTTYFVNSMGDLFHEDIPDSWIDKVSAVMALCPQHTFQVLTKRSARMREYFEDKDDRGMQIGCALGDMLDGDWIWKDGKQFRQQIDGMISLAHGHAPNDINRALEEFLPLPNVWLGVSAEDQTRADERIPDLLATPAAIRFVSCEPLLGMVDICNLQPRGQLTHDALREYAIFNGETGPALDWVIAGGESGHDARPMHPDWARSLRDQCAAADVPFFFKQWGIFEDVGPAWGTAAPGTDELNGCVFVGRNGWVAKEHDQAPQFAQAMMRVGKKHAGRMLDGRTHDAMPETRASEDAA